MRTSIWLICLLTGITATAQTIHAKLQNAVQAFEADAQMQNAILGFYVVNGKTSEVIFNRNGGIGLAGASTQKVVTSATAFETLGMDYRYKTELAYDGSITGGVLNGSVYIIGSGDPSTGSWRYSSTKENLLLNNWLKALSTAGIKKINGKIFVYDKNWDSQTIPGGWIWDDIGNYYGAGASGFNWRENQYDLNFKTGKPGDTVTVTGTEPVLFSNNFINEITAGKEGSGDNAYIYRAPLESTAVLRGTIPPNKNTFTISGSTHAPAFQLSNTLARLAAQQGFGDSLSGNSLTGAGMPTKLPANLKIFHTHLSPSLDSLNYWFLKKSVNLYGEALIKTLGFQSTKIGSTKGGVDFVKSFWKTKGIEETALRMQDGSGLSPQNRITPEALVKVMQYAKGRPWFTAFNNALPEINGLRMKSGTIGGAKSFTGYSGEYIFAIIVNNYNGSAGDIQKKMWRVLHELK